MSELRLEVFLPYRLSKIAMAVSRRFKEVYGKQFELSIPEWRVLATIAQFQSISAKEIVKHSDMHKTKVSRSIAKLERRRWLKREKNQLNRREEILTLTLSGRQNYKKLVPRMRALEEELLGLLGSDASAIDALMNRLEQVLLDSRRVSGS
ncbi:MAG: MarR family transcriptional regulator [Chelatococcus sp.]|nr:MarR family transcriptional regulator [Chelatococcus sp. HY11]MBX3547373.1 MarR family transcriptional regulator [Chelatococcus sp.]